jgi:MoaD family protein
MRVTVKYLSTLRDRAGTANEVFVMPAGSVLRDLTARIEKERGITLPDPYVMIVLNGRGIRQHPQRLDTGLSDGDTLLLLPPVSGG